MRNFTLTTATLIILLFGFTGLAWSGTEEVINDHLAFNFTGYTDKLMPGASTTESDTIAIVPFQLKYIDTTAPAGDIEQIDFYFYWNTDKWHLNSWYIDSNNWTGDIDSMGDWSSGSSHLKMTGTGTGSTTYKTFAYLVFSAKCQPAAIYGNQTYIYFDSQEDNGCLVDDGSPDWWAASDLNSGWILLSLHGNRFYIDYYDSASAVMGDSVFVPVQDVQPWFEHRLHTVTHWITYDSDKLEYLGYERNTTLFPDDSDMTVTGTDTIKIFLENHTNGYIQQPDNAGVPVKFYDLIFRVKGHSGGAGSSVNLEFVDDSSGATIWTKYNEGGGDGCAALDSTAYVPFYDGDIDIPAYTASMEITGSGKYSKGDGAATFDVCIASNFPAGQYASGSDGEINTLFDLPNFANFSNLYDSDDLNFTGGTCVNGDRVFHAEQYYDAAKTSYIGPVSTCTDMYSAAFSIYEDSLNIDYDNRFFYIPWKATTTCGGGYETSVTDTTGYVELTPGSGLDTLTNGIEMNMGFFYAPYSTDDDATVSQDVYLAANFGIDTFLVKIYVADNDGYITGVTIRDDDVTYTLQNDTVTLCSDNGYYEAASDDSLVKIATIYYRVYCVQPKTAGTGGPPPTYWNVTISVGSKDGYMEDTNETDHFIEEDINNVRGRCGNIIHDKQQKSIAGIPEEFDLHPNRPNPFNPTTFIAYDLPVSSNVEIQVLNILGQTVKTLIRDHKAAGRHEVVWDGTNENGHSVSSGIYFYVIRADDFFKSRKMVLMK